MVFRFGSKRKSQIVEVPASPTVEPSSSSTPAELDGAGKKQSQPIQDGAGPSENLDKLKSETNVSKPLDIVFLQDTTGSQGSYIDSARAAIRRICEKIIESSSLASDQLRFGLIAFRDHPPQDRTYVTKPFGFTSDIKVMQSNLASLNASGGGDGPEASTAALAAGLEMEWKEDAVKMLVLITDAPPHGLGEAGDGFTESPDQNDPLELARQMAQKGITLFVIACEPSLSNWKHAVDFYTALTQITGGRMFPLLMADKLGDYIVGSAVETIETEKLITEYETTILDDVYKNDKKVGEVVGNIQEFIKSRGVQLNTVVVEDAYRSSETAKSNVHSWANAKSLRSARGKVSVVQEPRLQDKYLSAGASDYSWSSPVSPSRLPPPAATRKSRFSLFKSRRAHDNGDEEIMSEEVLPTVGVPLASSAAYAAPSSSAYEAPTPELKKQDISASQAHRIVMQSMARNSKVTSEGMVSHTTGKTIASSEYMSSVLE